MQREEDGDYEDREGENFSATTDDPYISDRVFKCEKCGKKMVEKGTTLFAPFHCGRQMKLATHTEHSFDFESLTKRTLEKERTLFPGRKKHSKASNAKPIKHAKAKKAKKSNPVKKASQAKLKAGKARKPKNKKKRK